MSQVLSAAGVRVSRAVAKGMLCAQDGRHGEQDRGKDGALDDVRTKGGAEGGGRGGGDLFFSEVDGDSRRCFGFCKSKRSCEVSACRVGVFRLRQGKEFGGATRNVYSGLRGLIPLCEDFSLFFFFRDCSLFAEREFA